MHILSCLEIIQFWWSKKENYNLQSFFTCVKVIHAKREHYGECVQQNQDLLKKKLIDLIECDYARVYKKN